MWVTVDDDWLRSVREAWIVAKEKLGCEIERVENRLEIEGSSIAGAG